MDKINTIGLNELGDIEEDTTTPPNQKSFNIPIDNNPEAISLVLPSGYQISLTSSKLSIQELCNIAIDVLEYFTNDKPKRNGGDFFG